MRKFKYPSVEKLTGVLCPSHSNGISHKNDLTLCRDERAEVSYTQLFGMHRAVRKNQELSMLWSMAALATGCSCLTAPKTKLVFNATESLLPGPQKKDGEVREVEGSGCDVNMGSSA
jgi:hypothetical protein